MRLSDSPSGLTFTTWSDDRSLGLFYFLICGINREHGDTGSTCFASLLSLRGKTADSAVLQDEIASKTSENASDRSGRAEVATALFADGQSAAGRE